MTGVRIEVGEIRSIEMKGRSRVRLCVGLAEGLFAVVFLAAVTYPLWALFVS